MLHAHSPALCGMAALRAARRAGIPLVYEIRAFWEDAAVGNGTGREGSLKYRLTRALENRVVAGADAVVTICHGLRDDLIARGFPAGKIGIVAQRRRPDAVRRPAAARRRRWRASSGSGDGPVIGFIGSFYDYEGLDDLIAAMPALRRRAARTRGCCWSAAGRCEAALRAQAAASPAAARDPLRRPRAARRGRALLFAVRRAWPIRARRAG